MSNNKAITISIAKWHKATWDKIRAKHKKQLELEAKVAKEAVAEAEKAAKEAAVEAEKAAKEATTEAEKATKLVNQYKTGDDKPVYVDYFHRNYTYDDCEKESSTGENVFPKDLLCEYQIDTNDGISPTHMPLIVHEINQEFTKLSINDNHYTREMNWNNLSQISLKPFYGFKVPARLMHEENEFPRELHQGGIIRKSAFVNNEKTNNVSEDKKSLKRQRWRAQVKVDEDNHNEELSNIPTKVRKQNISPKYSEQMDRKYMSEMNKSRGYVVWDENDELVGNDNDLIIQNKRPLIPSRRIQRKFKNDLLHITKKFSTNTSSPDILKNENESVFSSMETKEKEKEGESNEGESNGNSKGKRRNRKRSAVCNSSEDLLNSPLSKNRMLSEKKYIF